MTLVPRSELEAAANHLAAEILASALRRCCEDNYSDPESAMRGYLTEAAARLSESEK